MVSWLEASCRASISPSIVSHHCVQWYKLARWMCQRMYSKFTFYFRKERVQTVQSVSKRSKSLLSYSANGRGTHLYSDLKKAQYVAAIMSVDFATPPFWINLGTECFRTKFKIAYKELTEDCKELFQRHSYQCTHCHSSWTLHCRCIQKSQRCLHRWSVLDRFHWSDIHLRLWRVKSKS